MSTLIPITTDLSKSAVARAVPGAYYQREAKAWVLNVDDITPRSAAAALKLFPELAINTPELTKTRDQLIQNVRPFDNATPYDHPAEAHRTREVMAQDDKEFYRFQELDLGYVAGVLQAHGGAYIAWERGLGKTIAALTLVEEMGTENVLIVAPNTAKNSVWEPECRKFLSKHFNHIEVLPNAKQRRERVLGWVKDWRDRGESVCLIVHYEALALIAKDKRGWEKYGTWDMVIADEAHRIKNPEAQMTRALKKVPTRYKVALSGTVIANHLEELFSPLQWLFPDRYRSKWRDWNDRFIDYVEGGYAKIPVGVKLDRLEELRRELGVFMVYRRKEDELDLPERTEQTLYVDLTSKQRKLYEELRENCIARLEDGSLIAAQEGVVMLGKLRQIASGLAIEGEDDEIIVDSSKINLAKEMILDNPDEAFVVFTWYKATARAMATDLANGGETVWRVDGDVPHDQRAEMIEAFQNGVGRVFVGTIATMGESVNLFRANNAIFLDISWNPGQNIQAADRIYRIGQEKPVTITHIVAKDTVDEFRVLPAVLNKDALRKMILGGTA